MAKTIGQLVNQAVEIRDERDTGDNTATRVGEMFIAIIEHLRDVSDVNSSNNGNNSSISLTGLLSSLSGMTDPDGNLYPNGAVLKYSGGAWGYDSYGGGTTTTTTGGGLTVAQLWTELDNPTPLYAANKVIPEAYLDLSNCIKTNATFWGNTINNNVVNGSLAGNISYIKFDYNNHTVYLGLDSDGNLRVSSDNGSGTANFYATGGVSALGYGSSGSGGNTSSESSSAPLDSNILKSINGFTASGVSNPSAGDLVYYSSNGWVYKKLGINDLTDVTISNLPSTSSDVTHVLTYDNTLGIWKNAPISATGGAEYLKDLQDVVINSNVSPSNYPVVLSKANNNSGTKFENTPLSNLFAAGNGIDITTQTVSNNNKLLVSLKPAATGQIGGIQVFGTGSSSITPQSGTTTHKYYGVYLDGSNKAYVDVPWTDNDHIYSNGNGLNLSSGGQFSIDDNYINGKWVTLNTEQTITATKTFTDHQILANNKALKAKDTNGSNLSIVEFDVNNQLAIGWNTTTETHEYDTLVFGNTIKLYSGNAQIGKKEAVRVLPSGVVELALATTGPKSGNTYTGAGPAAGLRIGDAVLYWDEKNQALALAKYNASTPSSPTAANFYATGGVSALGMSSGTGSVGDMTFGEINVGQINISDQDDSYIISVDHGDLLIDGVNDIVFNKSVYNNGELHVSPTNGIYIGSKWRFKISSNNCVLEHNDSSSNIPDWQPKGTWSAS